MPRHAGFAASITLTEAYLNQVLWLECQKLDPIAQKQIFRLPGMVPIAGGQNVRLSGLALFEPRPTLSLVPNPGNTVNVRASAVAYLSAALESNGVPSEERTWAIRLSTDVQVAADVEIAQDGLYLRWNPAGSHVNNLTVTELSGAPIPDFLIQALNSQPVRDALNIALQAVGPVRISGRLFPRTVHHAQPIDIEETQVSLFEWFVIDLAVTGAQIRVLDHSLAVGINLQGFPAGDPNQLVDLNVFRGDAVQYSWRGHAVELPGDLPVLSPGSMPENGADIVSLVNADVVRGIVDNVSSQIAGTPVFPNPGVRIARVTARPEFFEKPFRGREIGLRIDFTATIAGAADVTGTVYVQFFFKDPDWRVYIGHTVIDAPWWVDAAVILVSIFGASLFPMFTPLFAIGALAAIDGIIPSAIGNAVSKELSKNMMHTGTVIAPGIKTTDTPGPAGTPVTNYKGTRSIHMSTEGIGIAMTDVIPSVRFEEPGAAPAVARLDASLDAGSPAPYTFTLALRPDLASLAGDCSVGFVVSDAASGVEFFRTEGPYMSHRTLSFDHLTPDRYFVDTLRVQATIVLNRVQLEGVLFAIDTSYTVTDKFNRHHPFVTWEGHAAHFPNPTEPGAFWHRQNHPAIHRTAASARCLVLREGRARMEFGPEYLDVLDISWDQVPVQRRPLCDYCFFGGPDRTEPFPQEDWFKR